MVRDSRKVGVVMFHRLAVRLSLCAVLFVTGRAVAEEKVDATTPKGAALLFCQAMENGDVAAAKEMAVGPAKQLAVLDVLVPVVAGFKKLEAAAAKKWGEEGRKTLFAEGGPGQYDFKERLKTATEEIVKDVATITPADAKNAKGDSMKLKRIGDKWKLDMTSIPTEGLDNPTIMKTLKAMAETATGLATEIEQGKYPSAEAARDALRQRMLDEK